MSANKYLCIFSYQMEVIVQIFHIVVAYLSSRYHYSMLIQFGVGCDFKRKKSYEIQCILSRLM